MDLPLLSALFTAFALSLYVLLDGFDLGVGAILLVQPDEELRDRMVDSITPTWDGNETWLIMAGVALLAGFPIAYGILLPAFYLPLIIMLLALGLRGVSFEFRVQTVQWRRVWDVAFGLGSILAAMMQGLIVGGLIAGVSVDNERFTGSVFDVFQPFALLTALAMLAGYVVLGAGWLHLKATFQLRKFAERALRLATPVFVALAIAVCVAAAFVQPGIRATWMDHYLLLTLIAVLFFGVAGGLISLIGDSDAGPFASGICLFALGVIGLGCAIFPDIVPFRLSLWAAASATLSHVFLLVGAVVVTPVVLGYSAFAYRVFRGKIPEKGWET
ncbi:cytochrome d ubiquinol oxidase subunit II [Methylovirgula sp. 4M-Z18]|uniref:cytochrome d ubiquinol oxidase subunit II n=1 Tax=Methylovirgula sp. 4M-Z18 TaxID=2293567 RepID=UPI0013144118|nr:cytochrome d ubiquinol oxidase subunit II [Methylovirgula sp. 4M-Z18]